MARFRYSQHRFISRIVIIPNEPYERGVYQKSPNNITRQLMWHLLFYYSNADDANYQHKAATYNALHPPFALLSTAPPRRGFFYALSASRSSISLIADTMVVKLVFLWRRLVWI